MFVLFCRPKNLKMGFQCYSRAQFPKWNFLFLVQCLYGSSGLKFFYLLFLPLLWPWLIWWIESFFYFLWCLSLWYCPLSSWYPYILSTKQIEPIYSSIKVSISFNGITEIEKSKQNFTSMWKSMMHSCK